MSKFARIFVLFLLTISLTPVSLAKENIKPIQIKSAVVETEGARVVGQVKLCNSENDDARLTLEVKNLSINSFYKRNLSVKRNECESFKLRFSPNFGEMSNVGDELTLVVKDAKNLRTLETYKMSDIYKTKIVMGERDNLGCGDETGEDGAYGVCPTDFIYHTPSGLRIKLMEINPTSIKLKLIHVEWGGVKDITLYTGRSKEIRSNHDELERVRLTNVYGIEEGELSLKIESLES